MICEICGTLIEDREHCYLAEDGDEVVGVHSDCLIRKMEFSGDHKSASEIMNEDNFIRNNLGN